MRELTQAIVNMCLSQVTQI